MQRFHLNHGKIKEMVEQIKEQTHTDDTIALLRRIDFYLQENIRILKDL